MVGSPVPERTAEPTTKSEWRKVLLASRRLVPAHQHATEASALVDRLIEGLTGASRAAPSNPSANRGPDPPTASSDGSPGTSILPTPSTVHGSPVLSEGPVCAYVPVGTEPGSLALLDALLDIGRDVLLPVLPRNPQSSAAMDWGFYRGPDSLTEGPYRLRQPRGPLLHASAITSAPVVLIPALAVDQHGVRLGRGAGWYDRTLPLARTDAALVAIVRDQELISRLPSEPHDVLMTGVLTPLGGLRALPLALD
ncbi:MAG TPA: 5-formyltetrahydrofolate cyclo-ligase [Pseudonocardia sp.]|nr:5-formyltetrahydrofolate cyclo-ligase [Pseudonocardia sp.]